MRETIKGWWFLLALLLSGCATHSKITGKVVGIDGHSVPHAVVRAYWSRPSGSEHMVLESRFADSDGTFAFDAPDPPTAFEAESPDVKRFGRLSPGSSSGNVIVVR